MLRTSVTPTIINGGYRVNVILSEAKATIDVRMVPDENPAAFLEAARKVIDDPAVEDLVNRDRSADGRRHDENRLRSVSDDRSGGDEALSGVLAAGRQTGATDMSVVRAKQCYWINAAVDIEDGAKGLGLTAIRSAFSKANCTGLWVSSGTSSSIWRGPSRMTYDDLIGYRRTHVCVCCLDLEHINGLSAALLH